MYLSQRYFAKSKTIRAQLNYIVLLKIRGFKDLRLILNDCNLGIEIDDLQSLYKDATQDEMSFLKIGIMNRDDNKILSKTYRLLFY